MAAGVLVVCACATPAAERPGVEAGAESWRDSVASLLRTSAVEVEALVDAGWKRLTAKLGLLEPRHIVAYRGYGNGESIWVQGRLLANAEYPGPEDDDGWWDNLLATYSRWNSHEVSCASIELHYGGQEWTVRTDAEGYYEARLPVAPSGAGAAGVRAHHVAEDRRIGATHWVLNPSPGADYLVISDVDDTVLHTNMTDLLLAARLTFFDNAITRKPLAGAAALYRALARGDDDRAVNPVFYVSNSAWNLYDLIRDFLELNGFPKGPVLLRDIGLERQREHHKLSTVHELLARYPELPVLLIGDSGQHDASIYARVARKHPRRIAAVYIRDIDPASDSEYDARVDDIVETFAERAVPFLRVRDSMDVARHAVELGLLPQSALPGIGGDTAADEERELPIGETEDS